jgi:hypothetical protein
MDVTRTCLANPRDLLDSARVRHGQARPALRSGSGPGARHGLRAGVPHRRAVGLRRDRGLRAPLDGGTAGLVAKQFAECLAAPGFTREATVVFKYKRNLRIVSIEAQSLTPPGPWRVRLMGPRTLRSREPEAIAASDERSPAMVFRDRRVFRHQETDHVP